ncbi:MAG: hypothetical protein Q8R83_09480 [Legionellaceae bacterium]|nr:hypothetical protein [Legionellaceae bacterium]
MQDAQRSFFLSQLNMVLCLLLFLLPAFSAASTSLLRGQRYCEVIFLHGLSGHVYNTLNLNNCPSTDWKQLTAGEVKHATGAHFAYLNGPRYCAMDEAKNTDIDATDIKTFGKVQMQKSASLRLRFKDFIIGAAPYHEHLVERNIVWIFHAGTPIYELIDPKGQVFVMQSYSSEAAQHSKAGLDSLGSRLKLPKGWRFQTGILAKESELVPELNQVVVLHDNYKNLYQLASKDFLKQ